MFKSIGVISCISATTILLDFEIYLNNTPEKLQEDIRFIYQ